MFRSIRFICIGTFLFLISCKQNVQKVNESKKTVPVETKTSPVEDSAKNIIDRADVKIKDSSKKHNPSKPDQPK